MINIVINNITEKDHGKKNGVAKIRAISTSKIMNRIINKKNRIEKGFRVMEFIFIPHSKDEFLSRHFFIMNIINIGIRIIVIVIIPIIRQYKNIKHIINDRYYIKKLINKRCMPE